MGAAHSSEPRSVTMENPGPAGIIDISDEVVQRLKKGISQQAKEGARAKSKASNTEAPPLKPPPPPKQAPTQPATTARAAPAAQQTVVYQAPAQTLYAMPGGTTITAADVRRQKEQELQENDALWRKRLEQLEKTLNKTNDIMEKEYSTAVDDVRKRFANAAPVHQLPPCQDLKTQLIACYRAHPGETLKCAEEVAQFRNCVSLNRIRKLDAETEKASAPAAAKAG